MRTSAKVLTLAVLAGVLFCGCNHNGNSSGGSAFSGGSSSSSDDGSQKQQSQQKPSKGGEEADTEPHESVSGQPSADSDRGGNGAVAHRSVAEPGAPEGTVPNDPASPAKQPASSAPTPQH